jgi:hypothetical protein
MFSPEGVRAFASGGRALLKGTDLGVFSDLPDLYE